MTSVPPRTPKWVAEQAWWSDNFPAVIATVVLNERERNCIELHFSVGDREGVTPRTLAALGRAYNVTPRRIRSSIDNARSDFEATLSASLRQHYRVPVRYNVPVGSLPIDGHVWKTLDRRGVKRLNDLLALTREELRAIPGIGSGYEQFVVQYLASRDLDLAQIVN